MRRFSTAAAAAILLFTATGFAGYDNCETTGFSDRLRLMELTCVACGVQMYNNAHGKTGNVNPSEKWLATLAASARSFRELNPGESGAFSQSIVRKGTARANMQRVVISQVQAYGYCRQDFSYDEKIKDYITRDPIKFSNAEIAKILGFKGSILGKSALENYDDLLNDAPQIDPQTRQPIKLPLEDLRRDFRETASNLISKKDVDDELKSCLLDMRAQKVEQMTDLQSYQLCTTIADSCDLEHDFCVRKGMILPTAGSGSSQQGGKQPPRPPAPQPRLAPPPPPSVQ